MNDFKNWLNKRIDTSIEDGTGPFGCKCEEYASALKAIAEYRQERTPRIIRGIVYAIGTWVAFFVVFMDPNIFEWNWISRAWAIVISIWAYTKGAE